MQNFGVPRHDTECHRAQQVQSDTDKRAHDLDLKYPGSTFTQVLKSHGKDGIGRRPFCQSFGRFYGHMRLSWTGSCPQSD